MASTGSSYDLLVLGGGAAGLGASRAALWEGARVALVSSTPLGGDCTFTGCVPSKSLIEQSRSGATFDDALDHVAQVVETIAATENANVLRHEGADVYEGRGVFIDERAIEITPNDGGPPQQLRADKIIVATGSRPFVPPIDGLDGVSYATSHTFFEPRAQPSSLVIIGGGPIGCELGEAMARCGTQVTIMERGPRVLSRFEPDASDLVADGLRSVGIELMLSGEIVGVERAGGGLVAVHTTAGTVHADELLVATGRTPNTTGFGLDKLGVNVDERGWIVTDRYLRTTAKHVWAVGDVNGKQLLSNGADEMGRVAAWSALRAGRRYAYDPRRIPQVVFTTPEVASIGVLEADAPANSRVAEADMQLNDRALAASAPQGFVRLIAKPDLLTRHKAGGRLIGATIVGAHAGELINEAAIAMRSNMLAGRLAQTVRAYPSWSTIMQKAAARWFFELEGQGARPPRRS